MTASEWITAADLRLGDQVLATETRSLRGPQTVTDVTVGSRYTVATFDGSPAVGRLFELDRRLLIAARPRVSA
jgi:hypothetical protein